MYAQFWATIDHAIDGDSVVVRKPNGEMERIRVGGVDVPSRGARAEAGMQLIERWRGRRVHVRPTASRRVHTEIPAIVVDENGNNLGMQLLAHGKRLPWFPIAAVLLLALSTKSLVFLGGKPQ